MALVNWVYGANWTDGKSVVEPFYVMTNGVVSSSLSFVLNTATSSAISGAYANYRYVYSASGDKGSYINVDFTGYSKLTITAFHLPGSDSYYGKVGYSDASTYLTNSVKQNVKNTVVDEYTFSISSINEIKAITLGNYNVDSSVTNKQIYIRDIILS